MVKKRNKNILFVKAKLSDGSNFTNPAMDGAETLEFYKILKLTVKQLNEIIVLYATNDIDKFVALLTPQYYEILSTRLYSLKKSKGLYPEFETIRESFANALEVLQVALIKNANLGNITAQRDNYKESDDILHDRDRLLEYLESFNNQYTSMFGDNLEVRSTVSVDINPEYKEYIKLYGLPNNGIFMPDKLAEIIRRLGL
ncbi:MAG: hypothetical protein CXT73_05605 [Methanobacteriota archaeon]|jgi:hypothetical protein|nr:MAG: hypothetical protein CXT73_05605 [Euryarchaeota archaeon]